MQVLFESHDPDATQLRELAVNRLRFTLRRLSWLIPRARVQLRDINGPRGGIDKQCRLEIKTDTAGTLVITALASDWRTALDNTLARASQALVRIWRRNRRRTHVRLSAVSINS